MAANAGRTVAVIGGGWAGLAAAVEATRRGHRVTLFEMAPQLGGRSRGVEVNGLMLDNGQHILIGAYSATLALMRTLGVDVEAALLRTPLRFTSPDGSGLLLEPGSPIVAFARAVLGQRRWALRERLTLLAAATGWAASRFRCDESLTVGTLTARLPQTIRAQLRMERHEASQTRHAPAANLRTARRSSRPPRHRSNPRPAPWAGPAWS